MTTITFLPPISRWTFLKLGAARSETVLPTAVDPVNETIRMPSSLAGHEEGHVDRFLDVAARFFEHFPHLARHIAGELLLSVGNQLRRAEQQLGPPRRRHQTPPGVGTTRGRDGASDIVPRGSL